MQTDSKIAVAMTNFSGYSGAWNADWTSIKKGDGTVIGIRQK